MLEIKESRNFLQGDLKGLAEHINGKIYFPEASFRLFAVF